MRTYVVSYVSWVIGGVCFGIYSNFLFSAIKTIITLFGIHKKFCL